MGMSDWTKLYIIYMCSVALFTGCDTEIGQQDTNGDSDTATDTEFKDTISKTESDAAEITLQGPCPIEEYMGGIEVNAVTDFSSISGAIENGVVPASVHVLEVAEGNCALWKRKNLSCIPSCSSGEVCDDDGSCIAEPLQQDAGVITIEGLAEAVVMEPLAPTNSYSKVNIIHPIYVPGAQITMKTSNGYFGEMTMNGIGVSLLNASEMVWEIVPQKPLQISWESSTLDVDAMMHLNLNIDQHGSTPVTLTCDFEDDGEAKIPAVLIDALLQSGVSGKPSGRLIRQTVDSTHFDAGCVEFRITSSKNAEVRISK